MLFAYFEKKSEQENIIILLNTIMPVDAGSYSDNLCRWMSYGAETEVPEFSYSGNKALVYSVLILSTLKNGINRLMKHLSEDGITRSINPRMPMLRSVVVQV